MAASSSKNKDFSKMVVNDAMVDYVLSKYGNKWYDDEEMVEVILEDLWQRENNQHDVANDKGLESLEALGKRSKGGKRGKNAIEAEAIAILDEVFGKGQGGTGTTQTK
ncbi:hypothetical protein CTI12_AA212720 [Artemisia annua]|uniref:Uncharacterized protein n=1 Tax=Artemisia annua TaxID=35608 RepID=A0A2U1NXW1_ARTAN|nr:hypothetical protein CTI12_AA212720 [Artemisia annua]